MQKFNGEEASRNHHDYTREFSSHQFAEPSETLPSLKVKNKVSFEAQ